MLERVNFNPYAYRSAPIVDGLSVVRNDPVEFSIEKPASYREIYEKMLSERESSDTQLMTYDFSVPLETLLKNMFYNTSDPKDRARVEAEVRLGLEHEAKLISTDDLTWKILDLKDMAYNADYSGMSDAEKYTAIFDRYAEAFGSDFLKTGAIRYPGSDYSTAANIRNMLKSELEAVIGDSDKVMQASRVAQFGDKGDSEVRAAIAAKYPPMGKITLREFYYMVGEMQSVGVDSDIARVLYRMYDSSGLLSAHNMDVLTREKFLDKPLDVQKLCSTYDSMRNAAAKTFYNDVGTSAVVMRELFGVSFDGRGNAAAGSAFTVDFDALKRAFIESRLKQKEDK